MCAIFKSVWVRRLKGKPGVPYNRKLRVRGSPHPLFYDADLSLAAAESNAFRIQADLLCFEHRIAALSCFASGGVTRTANTSPLAFCVPISELSLVAFAFIALVIIVLYAVSARHGSPRGAAPQMFLAAMLRAGLRGLVVKFGFLACQTRQALSGRFSQQFSGARASPPVGAI